MQVCNWEKINPSEPSILSMVSSLQVDKKMKQPQNKQMKNSLPSNQGSDLQVQRLRAKLPYVYWTPPPSNNHTKSELHFKQTQRKQIDTTRNQSDNTAILHMKQSLFGCLRQKVCVKEIIVIARFTSQLFL